MVFLVRVSSTRDDILLQSHVLNENQMEGDNECVCRDCLRQGRNVLRRVTVIPNIHDMTTRKYRQASRIHMQGIYIHRVLYGTLS